MIMVEYRKVKQEGRSRKDVVIVSASYRMYVSTFYVDWFIERLREGYVDVANLFKHNYVERCIISFFDFYVKVKKTYRG